MKKLLLLITALFLLVSVEGQILRYSNYTAPTPPEEVPDFTDEYDTVYAAFTTKPHLDTATIQQDMVYSLDSAGYWDRMRVLYVFAAHEEDNESLINWISPGTYDADNVSSTAWTRFEGYTGDGAADYLSSNFVNSEDSLVSKRNSSSVGIYLRINQQEDNLYVYGASTSSYFRARSTTDGLGGSINSTATFAAGGVTSSAGLWIVTRTAHNATAVYRNGTSMDTDTDLSTGLPTTEYYILNRNGGAGLSTNQVAIFFIMDGVADATEAGKINTIFERYMDRIGKGVQ